MMCCGHNHGDHDSHRMEERVYEPMAATSATTPCPECGYPTQEDFVLCPPLWDGVDDGLPGMSPGGQGRLGALRLLRRTTGLSKP